MTTSRANRGQGAAAAPTSPQLALALASPEEPWRYTRPVLRSPHFRRIRERCRLARGWFPELDGIVIRVGLARARDVLGRGSLDPAEPGIWVRPRLLHLFTIAHELTHLLQARGLVPGGERACDLHALARSRHLVDSAPTYLRVPETLREAAVLPPEAARLLHETAVEALRERSAGRRSYLAWFERDFERRWRSSSVAVRDRPPLTAGTIQISAPSR